MARSVGPLIVEVEALAIEKAGVISVLEGIGRHNTSAQLGGTHTATSQGG